MNILLCPLSDGGYLYPAIAAARELRRRGNSVSVLGRASVEPIVAEAGLPFVAAEDLGVRGGFSATWWAVTGLAQYQATLRAAAVTRADLLVTSVLCHGPLLAAEALDLPVVVLGLSVYLWDYLAGGEGEPQIGRTRENRTRETLRLLAEQREQAGLGGRPAPWPHNPMLGDALLLRGDSALEYPGAVLPDRVHQVGPLTWEPAADPAEVAAVRTHVERTGKPIVYVHLGRFFGGINRWPELNAAFTAGRFHAVVEQGRSTKPQPASGADILLVRKPWMGPLIDLAELVLTSGTSAPVLAALLRGRPLVVSPNGSEQPLVAAACQRAGVGVHVGDELSDYPTLLASAWQDHGMRDRARELGRALAAAQSAARAADLIEKAMNQPTARGKPMRNAEPASHAAVATSASRSLEALAAGVLSWMSGNCGYLDSDTARTVLPPTPRAKAILQLGLLHHHWIQVRPDHKDLPPVTTFLREMWQRPSFPEVIEVDRKYGRQFGLMYCALAPAGICTTMPATMLERLQADGFLTAGQKSAYRCLATRYYADLAGASHHIGSYQELYESSMLGRRVAELRETGELKVADLEACSVTHTVFYLTHFGFRDPGLADDEKERALRIICGLTDHCVSRDEWDLVGKLILAQFCLGADPVRTPSGAAAIEMLAHVQMPDGAIPGRSLIEKVDPSAPTIQFFRKAFQTTLVAALTSLIISHPA